MLSFNNDPKLKEKVLEQLETYYKAKDIINSFKWGCTHFGGCEECVDEELENEEYQNVYNNYKSLIKIPISLIGIKEVGICNARNAVFSHCRGDEQAKQDEQATHSIISFNHSSNNEEKKQIDDLMELLKA